MSAAATQALTETESLNIQAPEEEITDKFEVLEARALELYARDQDSALELGKALIAVRDALKEIHGAFTAWYRDHDLDENRVHYCIRKMEGKITPSKKRAVTSLEMPEADFVLNTHNLHVANFAPARDGKHRAACVRVDGNGTTATDGFVVVQVSLPMGQPETTQRAEGNMPRSLVLRAARQGENLYCVTLGDTSTVIATPSCAVQCDAPRDYFPPYEKVIPKAPPITEIFIKDYENEPGSLSRLIELLSFARDFNPLGVVKLSCHQNGLLWLDCEPGPYGQRLRGGIQPITTKPHALPPAPDDGAATTDCQEEANA